MSSATTRIIVGDARTALAALPDASVQCCVTSPPYFGLRDYGVDGQIGLEPSPDEYVAELVAVFHEVRRVLRDDGTLWLNIGDSFAGSWGNQGRKETRGTQRPINGPMLTPVLDGRYPSQGSRTGAIPPGASYKPKDLLGIPWRVAFALQADGWRPRSEIIWHKPNPMPESVTDRPTSAHEKVFLLAKNASYFYDSDAITEAAAIVADGRVQYTRKTGRVYAPNDRNDAERITSIGFGANAAGTRNSRNVWTIATQPSGIAHYAMMPLELAERCIKAGSKPGDTVLDPFGGAGTTALVANRLGRNAVLVELSPAYADIARTRIVDDAPLFAAVAAE